MNTTEELHPKDQNDNNINARQTTPIASAAGSDTQNCCTTKEELQKHLLDAAIAGTLLTNKHDPRQMASAWDSPRSVLSFEMADNLVSFITAGEFQFTEYHNSRYPSSPLYIVITPTTATFSPPASGVLPFSPFAYREFNSLVALSGHILKWHLIGEDSAAIEQKLSNNELRLRRPPTTKQEANKTDADNRLDVPVVLAESTAAAV